MEERAEYVEDMSTVALPSRWRSPASTYSRASPEGPPILWRLYSNVPRLGGGGDEDDEDVDVDDTGAGDCVRDEGNELVMGKKCWTRRRVESGVWA